MATKGGRREKKVGEYVLDSFVSIEDAERVTGAVAVPVGVNKGSEVDKYCQCTFGRRSRETGRDKCSWPVWTRRMDCPLGNTSCCGHKKIGPVMWLHTVERHCVSITTTLFAVSGQYVKGMACAQCSGPCTVGE